VVRIQSHDRSEEQLPDVGHPGIDVAADVVPVVCLHRARAMDGPGQDPVAEARREALDLGLDRLGLVVR
jgi:hypothetical protein